MSNAQTIERMTGEHERTADGGRAAPDRERLLSTVRATLRATSVYAQIVSDRVEYVCATDPRELDGVASEHLVHLVAVAGAFQDAACHTLFFIDPELARNARVAASIAEEAASLPRGGAGA